MRRRIVYGSVILALAAIGAMLWVYREPRPMASKLEPPSDQNEADRVRQEMDQAFREGGIDAMRAKVAAMRAKLIRLREASEKERKQEQLRRQNTYAVVILASAVIVALIWGYLRWRGRHAVSVEQGSPPD